MEAVVRSAVSFAMQENIDTENLQSMDPRKLRNIRITKDFFELALEEVKPEFGVKEDDLNLSFSQGIHIFSTGVSELLDMSAVLLKKMARSKTMQRQALLLQGDMGTGKSALAAYIAVRAKYPMVRLLSADDLVGMSDGAICLKISKVFDDAYKSTLSIVIIDDFERIIRYTIGNRFSNAILQALLTCIRRSPKEPNRKVFVLATSTSQVVRTLELDRMFDFVRTIPCVNGRAELRAVLESSGIAQQCRPSLEAVLAEFPANSAGLGISEVLTTLELAINDENDSVSNEAFSLALRSKFNGSRSRAFLPSFALEEEETGNE